MSPGGAPVTTQRELTGERCSLAFTPAQLGFYTLGAPRPLYAFGVNPATDESDLRPIDKNLLPTEFADNHEAHFVAGAAIMMNSQKGGRSSTGLCWARSRCSSWKAAFRLLVRRRAA